jgi:glutamate synthase (NADPH/NADH) small chain
LGKVTGFMEWPRATPAKRAKTERLTEWTEFTHALHEETARQQAGRCMDCGVPFCHQGCPLGNLIPEFNEHVFRDHWEAAFIALNSTNNFPEFTGRLCPAPCEAACVLAIDQEPVTIETLEKEIAERAFREGWVRARAPSQRTGKRVAVVGSGPAGLAAAAQLNQAGHTVTVYERAPALGGLLRYGIPDFKLEKWVIDRRLAVLEEEGVLFRTGVDVGREPTFDGLRATHDALVLAVGAQRPRELDVPGRELQGVVRAMDFLEAQNRRLAGQLVPVDAPSAHDKRVIILGGGDTGSDCLGTALRQQAREVRQIELLPMPGRERAATNPWPQWPLIFRTSSSQEEGGERAFGLMTTRLSGEGGHLSALHGVQVELGRDEKGAFRFAEVPGSEVTYPVEMVVLAMGFVGPETAHMAVQLGLELDARGNVRVDGAFATSAAGVFAAGDASRGASLIVWAISDGREAARAADAFLMGQPSRLPTRGVHQPFVR